MKTRIKRLVALYYGWRAVRLGQKSISAARKAANYTPSPTGIEGAAVWFGYWSAWESLAEHSLAPIKAIMQIAAAAKEAPKVRQHATPQGIVEESDWTDSESSKELLKSGFLAPTTETKN